MGEDIFKFKHENVRQIALRISIVLGNEGGAFPVLKNLLKLDWEVVRVRGVNGFLGYISMIGLR